MAPLALGEGGLLAGRPPAGGDVHARSGSGVLAGQSPPADRPASARAARHRSPWPPPAGTASSFFATSRSTRPRGWSWGVLACTPVTTPLYVPAGRPPEGFPGDAGGAGRGLPCPR